MDWFEKDNFKRTMKEVVIVALQERGIAFYELAPVVQTTLLDEAIEVGVQQTLESFMNTKAVIEDTNPNKKFRAALLLEIYRERGKMLSKSEDATI